MVQFPAIFANKFFRISLVVAAIIIAIAEVSLYVYFSRRTLPGPALSEVVSSPTPVPVDVGEPQTSKLSGSLSNIPASNDTNVLLLGYGGGTHDGTYLTDSLTLLNINPDKKRINVISIPRDLYVSIPVDWDFARDSKINAAYSIGLDDRSFPNKRPQFRGTFGGGNLAKYVVSQVTGMPVGYYISVDFSKFVSSIDILGGISVNNPVAFEDNFYPISGQENNTCSLTDQQIADLKTKYSDFNLEKQFTCRYEQLKFAQGPVQMDGATTLKYVRSRHSAQWGSDFARSQRQQAVLAAIRDKVFSLNILDKANSVFQNLVKSVRTDITSDVLTKFLASVKDASQYKVNNIYLTDQNVLSNAVGAGGAYILIPKTGKGNFTGIQQYIKDNSQ